MYRYICMYWYTLHMYTYVENTPGELHQKAPSAQGHRLHSPNVASIAYVCIYYIRMQIHIYIYKDICISMNMYVSTHIYIYIHVYIYIHIHICMHRIVHLYLQGPQAPTWPCLAIPVTRTGSGREPMTTKAHR